MLGFRFSWISIHKEWLFTKRSPLKVWYSRSIPSAGIIGPLVTVGLARRVEKSERVGKPKPIANSRVNFLPDPASKTWLHLESSIVD